MTIQDLGQRVKEVRKEILKLNQGQLAKKSCCKQASISRLEVGGGVSSEVLLKLLEFFISKDINIHSIFITPFDLTIVRVSKSENVSQIIELVKEVKKNSQTNFDRLSLLLSALEQ